MKPKVQIPSPSVSTKTLPKGVVKDAPALLKFKFAFEHWKQRELFGLKYQNVSQEWFVSLLEVLKTLSEKNIDKAMADSAFMRAMRFHGLSWGKGVSGISEEKFKTFIPSQYHSEDYEIYQFQISISKGRVVGFFDESRVFQIVLLDPAHNIQLSEYSDYKTRETSELENCHQKIIGRLAHVLKILNANRTSANEKIINELILILEDEGYCLGHFVFVDDSFYKDIQKLLEEGNFGNIDHLLMELIIHYSEKNKK